MKKMSLMVVVGLGMFLVGIQNVGASMLILEGRSSIDTTGEQFEGVSNEWALHQVLEIDGLEIQARTTDPSHSLNANNDYFGISSDILDEDNRAFDAGEVMQIKFDKSIRINQVDFNLFDSSEEFVLSVDGGITKSLAFSELSNQSSDYYNFETPLEVAAGTIIEFKCVAGSVGIDGIELDVIPEPTAMGLVVCSGMVLLVMRRFYA